MTFQAQNTLRTEDRQEPVNRQDVHGSLNGVDDDDGAGSPGRGEGFLTDESWTRRDQLLPREYPCADLGQLAPAFTRLYNTCTSELERERADA